MIERYTIRGTYKRKTHEVTWENFKLTGSETIIKAFEKLGEEMKGAIVGPFGASDNFHESPIATLVLLEKLMPKMKIIEGQDYVDHLDSLSII